MEIPESCAVGINEMLETNTIIKKETREFARLYTLRQFVPGVIWQCFLEILEICYAISYGNSSIGVLVINTKVNILLEAMTAMQASWERLFGHDGVTLEDDV